MAKKTTIHDIARELNFTSGTVSRALNDNPRISIETKRLVNEKSLELNYQRNTIASSLRSGKSHTIGVIIPSAQMNFFGSVVHGIQMMASCKGYNIVLYQTEETSMLEKRAIETFLSARVDGILASVAKETTEFSHFEDLKKRNIPMVFFDRTIDELNMPSVVIDDYLGGFLAAEHLIDNGYKNIAHVSGPQQIKGFRDRQLGYMDALRQHNILLDENLIYKGDLSIESGKSALDYFLSLPNQPDAVFAVEDYTALGIMKGLKERQIKIPEQFGVIGFANEGFGEHITPSLSSVDQQTVQMGKEALGLLIALIETKENGTGAATSEKLVLQPQMHFRQSSKGKVVIKRSPIKRLITESFS